MLNLGSTDVMWYDVRETFSSTQGGDKHDFKWNFKDWRILNYKEKLNEELKDKKQHETLNAPEHHKVGGQLFLTSYSNSKTKSIHQNLLFP